MIGSRILKGKCKIRFHVKESFEIVVHRYAGPGYLGSRVGEMACQELHTCGGVGHTRYMGHRGDENREENAVPRGIHRRGGRVCMFF